MKLIEYHKHDELSFGISIQNSKELEDYCLLNLTLFGHSWWFETYELFKPIKKWVDLSDKSWSDSKGYWDNISRKYGFWSSKEALHLYYGIQPGSWIADDPKNSDHSKVYFFPWYHKRRMHIDYLNPDGTLFKRYFDNKNESIDFDTMYKIEENIPKTKFKFNDFDGEEIIATCHVEESVYRQGIGWFKWIGYLLRPEVYRHLELNFSSEVGYEKGSWKGGTLGHSCKIDKNESPKSAFTKYGSSKDFYKNYGERYRGFTNIQLL